MKGPELRLAILKYGLVILGSLIFHWLTHSLARSTLLGSLMTLLHGVMILSLGCRLLITVRDVPPEATVTTKDDLFFCCTGCLFTKYYSSASGLIFCERKIIMEHMWRYHFPLFVGAHPSKKLFILSVSPTAQRPTKNDPTKPRSFRWDTGLCCVSNPGR